MGKTTLETHRNAILKPKYTKDMQRSKLYRAENIWRGGLYSNVGVRKFESVLEMQEYVDRLMERDYVRRRFFLDEREYYSGPSPILVRPGFGCRNAFASNESWVDDDGYSRWGPAVTMPGWSRNEPILLHEVAHHLAALANEHKWPFAAAFHDLVRNVMGADAAAGLKAEFKKAKVRMFPPPQMPKLTPEQKAAALANLQKANAARTGQSDA